MNSLFYKAKRAFDIWRKNGFSAFYRRLIFPARENLAVRRRQKWFREFGVLTAPERDAICLKIENLAYKPLISVVLPVYNVEEKWLRLCVESVLKQLYENWEFCIADDCSSAPHVKKVLAEYAAKDSRFKIIYRAENGHISAASNTALELATGEFVAFLDHDDELAEHALYHVAKEINAHPETDLIYSDEAEIGNRHTLNFKPDWSPELFYSLNLITHLAVYRTEIIRKVSGFRLGAEGSQDYDLALRVVEQIPENHIRHIPQILYFWRAISGSVALDAQAKPYAHERARQAIREHFQRTGVKARVSRGFAQYHRVSYELPENFSVSVIAVEDSVKDFENAEVINVANDLAETFNQAAQKAAGDVLIFLGSGVKPISGDWIRELASLARQKKIGAAGAKIFYPNETVRHGGIILGAGGLIGFAHRNLLKDEVGNFARAQVANNFSAVSGVLAVRRELFEKLGGFDTANFQNGLFEIDFCLRLREKKYRIAFTPYAEFVQTADSATETILKDENSKEVEFFSKKWQRVLDNDPYHNPNFSLTGEPFPIAFPPRTGKI